MTDTNSAAARLRNDLNASHAMLTLPEPIRADLRAVLDEHAAFAAYIAEHEVFGSGTGAFVLQPKDRCPVPFPLDAAFRCELSGGHDGLHRARYGIANAEWATPAEVAPPAVATCECGCVPGQPCICTLNDCECIGDCAVCDADATTHQPG